MSDTPPTVSIVIPTLDGAAFLTDCLDSLAQLDYPRDLFRVVVVDNASTDDTATVVDRHPLPVEYLRLDTNRGFAGAVNAGVEHATGELVALLNNDMRVEPTWLRVLVDTLGADDTIGCVASPIVDWSGERVDFHDAAIGVHGFASQPGVGRPVDEFPPARHDMPFACGGAMLLARATFLDVGGLDEAYFAYFEDVDLGWRLRLRGLRIVMAQGTSVQHHHNGTSRRMAPEQRTLLLERNALFNVYKNVGEERRDSVLAEAVMLLVARSLDEMRSSRDAYAPFAKRVWGERVPATAIARLHAVVDLLETLPHLEAERSRIQSARTVSDDDVLAGRGAVTEPLGATSPEYAALHGRVTKHGDAAGSTDQIGRIGRSQGRLGDARRRSLIGAAIARLLRR